MTSNGPKTRDLRIFGLTVGAAFAAIGWFLLSAGVARIGLLGIGGTLFLLGAALPNLLAPAYGPWMKMAEFLGAIMTRVLLTVFYFTVLVPFTLIRLGDPLRLKLGSDIKSFWQPARNSETTIERFRRPF